MWYLVAFGSLSLVGIALAAAYSSVRSFDRQQSSYCSGRAESLRTEARLLRMEATQQGSMRTVEERASMLDESLDRLREAKEWDERAERWRKGEWDEPF